MNEIWLNRLKRLLQTRLTQAGWTYAVKRDTMEYIREEGVDKVNISHVLTEMQQKASRKGFYITSLISI